ncbi:hypothetical protein ACLK19_03525 [Escherichia coli]
MRALTWSTTNATRWTSFCGRCRKRANPSSPSPRARGRPGWHIECSAMNCSPVERL